MSDTEGLYFEHGLDASEIERLAVLIEECAEVSQAACKVLRHGYSSYNPFDPDQKTNQRHLAQEIGHLLNAISMMKNCFDICPHEMSKSKRKKKRTIRKYLHFQ